jgi:predicted transposase YdaD
VIVYGLGVNMGAVYDYGQRKEQKGRIEGKREGRIEGKREGRIEGKREGRIEGKREGRIEGKVEVLRDIYNSGKSIDEISKMTNIGVRELEEMLGLSCV